MNTWVFLAMLASIIASTAAFVWLAVTLRGRSGRSAGKNTDQPITDLAEHDVEHIFDADFREELRNRGRLYFEKIIGENAMFLQQDLRLTTSQLNEYMKSEITRKLKEEFAKYEQSITDAKQLALDSINKTQALMEQQRQLMSQQLAAEIAAEKKRQLELFNANMADIVNHYVLAAIGDQIDLTDQLDFIIGELESQKQAILEDLSNGT